MKQFFTNNLLRTVLLLTTMVASVSSVWAQTATIGAGAATSSTGSNVGPIYRSSAGSGFDFSQHYYLFTAAELAAQGIPARVVSMPSTDVFDRQDKAYQLSVLGKGLPRVAIEAGVTAVWHKYVGLEGAVVGIDTFGESAPAGVLFKYFGFTVENVVAKVKAVLA